MRKSAFFRVGSHYVFANRRGTLRSPRCLFSTVRMFRWTLNFGSRALCWVALCLGGSSGMWADTTELERLPEILRPELHVLVNEALAASPQLLLSRLETEMAAASAREAASGLYPRAVLYTQFNYQQETRRDVPGTLASTKHYYDVAVEQALFHWNAQANRARLGAVRRAIAETDLAEANRQLAFEIYDRYLQLIWRRADVERRRAEDRLEERLWQEATGRKERGETAEETHVQAEIDRERQRLALDEAEAELQAGLQALARILGRERFSLEELATEVPPVGNRTAEAKDAVASGSPPLKPPPALQRHAQEIRVAELDYAIARTGMRPKVDLVAGLKQDEQSYTTNIAQKYGVDTRYIGVRVRWNIFDGFETRAKVARTRAAVRLAESAYSIEKTRLTHELIEHQRALERAARELELSEREFALAERQAVFATEEHAAGRLAETEWERRQIASHAQQAEVYRQRAFYAVALAQFVSDARRLNPSSSSPP